MGSNGSMFMVFLMMVVVICVGVGYLYFQLAAPEVAMKVAVRCQNDTGVISFLINEEGKTLTMEGQEVDAQRVKIFNETAISAEWPHNNGGTRIFLDRIAGRLELETRQNETEEWVQQLFDCNRSGIRF